MPGVETGQKARLRRRQGGRTGNYALAPVQRAQRDLRIVEVAILFFFALIGIGAVELRHDAPVLDGIFRPCPANNTRDRYSSA